MDDVTRIDKSAEETFQLEGHVQKFYKGFNERNVFCCGGSVTLPEHDIRSLIVKLLDSDPSKGGKTGSSGQQSSVCARQWDDSLNLEA